MDRGAWRSTVLGVKKSWTRLTNTCTFSVGPHQTATSPKVVLTHMQPTCLPHTFLYHLPEHRLYPGGVSVLAKEKSVYTAGHAPGQTVMRRRDIV